MTPALYSYQQAIQSNDYSPDTNGSPARSYGIYCVARGMMIVLDEVTDRTNEFSDTTAGMLFEAPGISSVMPVICGAPSEMPFMQGAISSVLIVMVRFKTRQMPFTSSVVWSGASGIVFVA